MKNTLGGAFAITSLTIEQIRLNHLRKQYALDERKPTFFDIAREQLGLHSTDYWTPYLSVWARIGNYDAEKIFRSLNCGDRLVRLNAFRATVHVVHVDNLPLLIRATGSFLYKRMRQHPDVKGLSDQEVESLTDSVLAVLEDGPKTMEEIKKLLPDQARNIRPLFTLAATSGKVIRATASHARNPTTAYALIEKWVNGFVPSDASEEEALREVIRLYVMRFGPVTIDDISWWLPITKTKARTEIEQLSDEIIQVQVEGEKKHMFADDAKTAASLEAPADPVVWLLPYEDYLPKAFTNRAWYMSEEQKPMLFPQLREHYWPPDMSTPVTKASKSTNASGEIRPTVWIDGEAVGRWELEPSDEKQKVVFKIYREVRPKYGNMISEKASELEDFVNTQLVPISSSK
ncbi:MAG: AlkZ family DNA glycosylase [Candidatus Thorarchaeota archaeon]|nr:MAG: AlkZ family DNA glycosylase [Candidatus Thorarchaeota archaeon]